MFQRNTLNRLIQIILILKILKWIYSTKSLEKENLNEITPKLIPYLNFHEKKRKKILTRYLRFDILGEQL